MKLAQLPFFLSLLGYAIAYGQSPSTFEERKQGFEKRQALENQSMLQGIPFHSIGPTVFGGRIADFAINPNRTHELFVAYASGGLWYSDNKMASAIPIFDDQMVMTLGDIAVNWKDSILWVGTGEVNASRSSFAGTGIYKSTDWGKSWQHMGLGETQHIGRIILHPEDKNVAWIAALGKLYSTNPERGIFKTTDGGKTWRKTLFVNDSTGVVDLVLDPQNPNILYAAAWERSRKAWDFIESGAGSGIYQSTDGGENWILLSNQNSGFPTGKGVGRIGLDIYNDGNKRVLYAFLDNYNRKPGEKDKLTVRQLEDMSNNTFLNLSREKLKTFWDENNLTSTYPVDTILKKIQNQEITPKTLYEYLSDGQSQLFDTPVKGAEVYVSKDGGKTWKKTHKKPLDKVYFSYGYYFGQIRVNPNNADEIYIAGVPALKSVDGGKSFHSLHYPNMHVDHHAIWVHPEVDGIVAFANDGGLNLSYDGGKHFEKLRSPPVGQFYSITLDNATPFNVYGGLQDNGVWKGPSNYEYSVEWEQEGAYPYERLLGGDGMQTMVDKRNPNIVYTGFQFGYYYRLNLAEDTKKFIQPKHKLGERPYRFNWQTPILLSEHNQDILYLGGNKLFRSLNQGDDWMAISDDLTKGGKPGDVPYGTITCIAESPKSFGTIYVGTDDGLVHCTEDGGHTWENISAGLPPNLWVTKVELSKIPNRIYVTLSGYRFDDFNAYLYKSDDNGKTWESLGSKLPHEPINVMEEDPSNPQILYVGTDHGLYLSTDSGHSFMLWNANLPAVSIHDIEVHHTGMLVVGTHGRSIYKADLAPLYAWHSQNESLSLLTDSIGINHQNDWGNFNPFNENTEPNVSFFIGSPDVQNVTYQILDDAGKQVWKANVNLNRGINQVSYSLETQKGSRNQSKAENGKYYLTPGTYWIVLEKGSNSQKTKLLIKN